MKNVSRAELARQVEFLKSELAKLAAVVYVTRKITTYHEYLRLSSSWSYVPQTNTNAITAPANAGWLDGAANGQGSVRSRPAYKFQIPSITAMYEHTLISSEL